MNRGILLVAICAAAVGISYGMHSPIVPVFAREELGADYSEVGLIGTVNYLPFVFAPILVGLSLDRLNKAWILVAGILLNIFSIFMLSSVQSVPEIMVYRTLAGIAHALFWPSSEVLVSTISTRETRVKGAAIFTAAWVGGFMVGPLIGKVVLDFYDYTVLFQLSSAAIATALVPAILLQKFGRPVVVVKELERRAGSLLHMIKSEMTLHPVVSTVLLYYAASFGVVLAVYPAYMGEASLTEQTIEVLFFAFGLSRFATLFFVHKISRHGTASLALAVAATAAGMLISFLFSSVVSFVAALVLIGFGTSIFYPVLLGVVTKDVPPEKMGTRLGMYETLFGMGWTAGPIAVGVSSDAFGANSPYLGFFLIGSVLSGMIMLSKSRAGHRL